MSAVRFRYLFALHLIAWTLVPALSQRNAPLDVIEGFGWGREWLWGTYKHPPLQPWLLEISRTVFGSSAIGYFGLSALCGGLALWAVYKTGEMLADKTSALTATALAQCILYFTFLSPEFNPNTLQLLFWALAGYAFTGVMVKGTSRFWIALALIFAAGLYAKYFMAVCGASFLLFMIMDKDARQWFRRPQPYVAALICAVLLLPHLVWLKTSDYLPFKYAMSRFTHPAGILNILHAALTFTSAQLAALSPCLILALVLLYPFRTRRSAYASWVGWLAFASLILIVAGSIIAGRGMPSMWGMPTVTFVPLWLITRFQIHASRFRIFAAVWSAIFVVVLLVFAGGDLVLPRLGFNTSRGQFPGRGVAEYYSAIWNKKTPAPLLYVAGDEWEAGNVAFYSTANPRPHVWLYGTEAVSPWIDEDDVLRHGAVVVWNAEEIRHPEWLDIFQARFPGTMIQPEHTFGEKIILGSAILLPTRD